MQHFAKFHGLQELVLLLAKSNGLIYALKLRVPKGKTSQRLTVQESFREIPDEPLLSGRTLHFPKGGREILVAAVFYLPTSNTAKRRCFDSVAEKDRRQSKTRFQCY